MTASLDRTARVWDSSTGTLLLTLEGPTSYVRSAAYSPAGDRIATASGDRTARVWCAATGALLLTLAGHISGAVHSAAYSPAGYRIVTASTDGTTRVWGAATGEQHAVRGPPCSSLWFLNSSHA